MVKSLIWSVVDWLAVVGEAPRDGINGCGRGWGGWVTVYGGEVGGCAGIVGTVLALDLLHDAWFYWTHRLLHTTSLYRSVHYKHHQSRYVITEWGGVDGSAATGHPTRIPLPVCWLVRLGYSCGGDERVFL